jgi:hypothetical protein
MTTGVGVAQPMRNKEIRVNASSFIVYPSSVSVELSNPAVIPAECLPHDTWNSYQQEL